MSVELQDAKAGKPQKYKARLCAWGFRQEHGLDYEETFSPVVRHDTTRVMLAIAAHDDMITQFDVKTFFLYEMLKENVCTEILQVPNSVSDENIENINNVKREFVCKLKKSLYELFCLF